MTPAGTCTFLRPWNGVLRHVARMEYALKASGDFADGTEGGIAAAWDRFANEIDGAFCKSEEF